MSNPADDLALLISAAEAAGDLATPYWRADPKTWDKGDGQGPVTEADLAVDALLRERLMAARPDYGWLSEETQDTPERLSAERVFIVDPIDGTRSFIAGEKHWAHSLAVVEAGEVIAAAVYLPMSGKFYSAALGGGATLNGAGIEVRARATLDGADVLTARPNLDPVHWPGGVPNLARHFRPSLAYRMALVAEGRFDGMLTLRDTWEWDVAAGTLLCREAGGQVSDRTGAPPRFNNPHPALRGLIAGGPAVQAGLAGAVMPPSPPARSAP